MYKGHKIAVAMPMHDERDHLARAIGRVPVYVDLIIAVDDGSTDGTWSRLVELRDARLIRLRHSVNRGVGAATKTGYRRAVDEGADLIVVMDGDGQMDGDDLHRLLDRALDGVDYVKGNRFLHTESISCMPFTRYAGNRILSMLTRRVAGLDRPIDAQCGYTVFRRAAIESLGLENLYERYGFLNELLFAVVDAGMSFDSVAVRSVYGAEISGVNPIIAVPKILCLIARRFIKQKTTADSSILGRSRRDGRGRAEFAE